MRERKREIPRDRCKKTERQRGRDKENLQYVGLYLANYIFT